MAKKKQDTVKDAIKRMGVADWHHADQAIKRGQHPHVDDLVDLLRSEVRLSRQTRDYLADLLTGKAKRPRGRPAAPPAHRRLQRELEGARLRWAAREALQAQQQWIIETGRSHGSLAHGISIAAAQCGVHEDVLRNLLRRGRRRALLGK